MLLATACIALVLRSAFTAQQASLLLLSANDPSARIRCVNTTTIRVLPETAVAMLLVVPCGDDAAHKFLHRNYTMFRCLWGSAVTCAHKIDIFRDIDRWMTFHNKTLTANFEEADDDLAWNLASRADE
jgi:hypothetical protein